MCVSVCVCECVYECGYPKRAEALDPLKLELQAVMSCLMSWVLGIEPFLRIVHILNLWASLQPSPFLVLGMELKA